MESVTTKSRNLVRGSFDAQFTDGLSIQGVREAIRFAMKGNLISAKNIVRSFGYCGTQRWPELENWPEQARLTVRCL